MKKIPFLISFLLIVQMASAQWNVIGWNPYLQRDTSGDSTFVLSAPSRIAIQNGVANWTPSTSGGASYLVYTALLTQTGTSAPVATVLENTLGGTVVWSYAGAGDYVATLTGAFTSKTVFPMIPFSNSGAMIDGDINNVITISASRHGSSNYVELFTLESGGPADGWLSGFFFEIRVYP